MKTLICLPCLEQIPAFTVASLVNLERPDAEFAMELGSLVYIARNNLAVKAIDSGAEWTLWIDSDMVFLPNTLKNLLAVAEKNHYDILSTVCYQRRGTHAPCLMQKLEIGEDYLADFEEFDSIPNHIFEVAGCGFGCVLIRTKVFKDVFEKFGDMFGPLSNMSEDYSFCYRARQLGYRIYADPSFQIGHVGQAIYTEKSWRKEKK